MQIIFPKKSLWGVKFPTSLYKYALHIIKYLLSSHGVQREFQRNGTLLNSFPFLTATDLEISEEEARDSPGTPGVLGRRCLPTWVLGSPITPWPLSSCSSHLLPKAAWSPLSQDLSYWARMLFCLYRDDSWSFRSENSDNIENLTSAAMHRSYGERNL